MTTNHARASSRTSKLISASPQEVYAAFMDPEALVEWLPPAEMTGEVHAFDARVGGGYEMSLYYPPDESFPGKTSAQEDRVKVRFLELEPARRIVEAVLFDSPDPAFQGEMRIEITFEKKTDGTEVTFHFKDLPPGLKPEDNDAGTQLSLDQLAERFEGSARP